MLDKNQLQTLKQSEPEGYKALLALFGGNEEAAARSLDGQRRHKSDQVRYKADRPAGFIEWLAAPVQPVRAKASRDDSFFGWLIGR
jgi:hypothetical protein